MIGGFQHAIEEDLPGVGQGWMCVVAVHIMQDLQGSFITTKSLSELE
jgi:hypothetical protein